MHATKLARSQHIHVNITVIGQAKDCRGQAHHLPQQGEANKTRKKMSLEVEANLGQLKQRAINMVKTQPLKHARQGRDRGPRKEHIT